MTGSRWRRSGRARKGGSISSRLSGWVNDCLLEPVAIAIAWKMLDDGAKEEEEKRHSAEWHECVWKRKEEGKETGWDRRKEGGEGEGVKEVCAYIKQHGLHQTNIWNASVRSNVLSVKCCQLRLSVPKSLGGRERKKKSTQPVDIVCLSRSLTY